MKVGLNNAHFKTYLLVSHFDDYCFCNGWRNDESFFSISSMFWFAVMVGFMYDSYYSGIFGVYMAIFAVIVRVIGHIRGKISINPFTLGLALIFLLTITETGVYIIYTLIGIQHLTVQQFLVQRLGSSLILNIVLYYLLYIPLKNFALWVQSGISHEKISLRATRRNQGNSYHYH